MPTDWQKNGIHFDCNRCRCDCHWYVNCQIVRREWQCLRGRTCWLRSCDCLCTVRQQNDAAHSQMDHDWRNELQSEFWGNWKRLEELGCDKCDEEGQFLQAILFEKWMLWMEYVLESATKQPSPTRHSIGRTGLLCSDSGHKSTGSSTSSICKM